MFIRQFIPPARGRRTEQIITKHNNNIVNYRTIFGRNKTSGLWAATICSNLRMVT